MFNLDETVTILLVLLVLFLVIGTLVITLIFVDYDD